MASIFGRQVNLVGKGAQMMTDRQFTDTIETLFIKGQTKFCLADRSKGWDCLNSLHDFFCAAGAEFPKQWKDYNEQNYAERWRKDEQTCRQDFKEFLLSLGQKIENPAFAIAGDVMLFEGKRIPIFPAIYLGNGKMIMVFREGVLTLPYNKFKSLLKEVRRLV